MASIDTVDDHVVLVEQSVLHGVHLLLRSSSVRPLLQPSAQTLLDEQCGHDLVRTTQVVRDLPLVSHALRDLPWVVVKGPVLDEHVYPAPGKRAYADLDVLVAPGDLEAALDSLEGAGAVLVDRNLVLAQQQRRGELDLRLPGGSVLDLHWDLVNEPSARSRLALPTTRFLADSRPVELAGVPVWRLEGVDALVHLAVHTLLSGADRLVWALDLRLSTEHPEFDAEHLLHRYARLAPLVDLALSRAGVVLTGGRRLARRTAWTAAAMSLSKRRPMGSHRDEATGRPIYAATRPTSAASVTAYLRGARRRRGRLAHSAPSKAELSLPRDSPAERRAFFRHVVEDFRCPG